MFSRADVEIITTNVLVSVLLVVCVDFFLLNLSNYLQEMRFVFTPAKKLGVVNLGL